MTNLDGHKPKAKRNGLMSFLAMLPTIEAQIKAGVLLVDIYTEHAGKLRIGYTQFTRYVNRHIRKNAPRPDRAVDEHQAGKREPSAKAADAPTHSPKSLQPQELPTFHYDPMDAYRYRNK